jgi:hypothetical protein
MKYTCDNHYPVRDSKISGGIAEAASIFATRKARLMYGRNAVCRVCNQTAYREDGSMATYSAFVGLPRKGGNVTGSNVTFSVYVSTDPD